MVTESLGIVRCVSGSLIDGRGRLAGSAGGFLTRLQSTLDGHGYQVIVVDGSISSPTELSPHQINVFVGDTSSVQLFHHHFPFILPRHYDYFLNVQQPALSLFQPLSTF